ncbi:MAG: PD-(D/E)XK nuclease domain-containing protein, partial [Gammaproteobacteria bacterium]
GNPYLYKAVLTGIVRVAQTSIFSDLNNLAVYTPFEMQYADHFGFTEQEVELLFEKLNITYQAKEIKNWYNGYQVYKTKLYNPWSILRCLQNKGELGAYWNDTGEQSLIGKSLPDNNAEIGTKLHQLLDGKILEEDINVTVNLDEVGNTKSVWNILHAAGYLNAEKITFTQDGAFTCKISIPNFEVRIAYNRWIQLWYSYIVGEPVYNKLLLNLISGDMEPFEKNLQTYFMNSISFFDLSYKMSERMYHVFTLGLLAGLSTHFYIESNQESGLGRFDIAVIPRDFKKYQYGIVFEFKIAQNKESLENLANLALEQIKNKQYDTKLKERKVPKIVLVGVAFYGKELVLKSKEI